VKIWDASTLTPDQLDQREFLSVVNYWIAKAVGQAEIGERIWADRRIGEAIRQKSVSIAEEYFRGQGH
jgi:hypothetical protein